MLLVNSTNWGMAENAVNPYLLEITITSVRDSDISLTLQCSTPEKITETPAQSKFKDVTIQGRSSLFYFDNVGNRVLNLPLKLSADNIQPYASGSNDTSPIETLTEAVNILKALATPQYTSGGIVPNYVFCKVGEQFTIKGTIQLGNLNWSLPIRHGHYCTMDTTITITEVRNENLSSDDYLNNEEYSIEDI